ncbi:DNA-3-methyladenine glycosylase family protein [Nocardia carnea]|uniref:DNA-3-methyladenine glycosylase family protein n=1 Tax=Nocardia carnea TaxID=37328 RepID=UPI002457A80D|nr:DNA-3-methyladenine glycosylase 2 family protein [Nocardia carnea]
MPLRSADPPPVPARLTRVLTADGPIDLAHSLAPLRRGPADPCHRIEGDGAHWRVSRMRSGPVTYRLSQTDSRTITADAWGAGAAEFLDQLDRMFCLDEKVDDFVAIHPTIAATHQRNPGLRMLRTGRVFEALVPAILEQKVTIVSSHAAWRTLVHRFGEPPPGPAPAGMRVPPDAATWARIPSWSYHRANVGPQRSQTIVRAARVADSLERTADLPPVEAARRLRTIPGIGEWTAAETAQRAFGDADALSVGDFHLASLVGWTLLGRDIDDAEMVEYLEPVRPHRYRTIRLLEISGQARKPRFGPRAPITDHSRR